MQIIDKKISQEMLKEMSKKMFGNIVKAVVDLEREIMVVDAPFHADQENLLLEEGSQQEFLWGINIHPAKFDTDDWIEFDSMINIRPSGGNMTRGVDDLRIQAQIRKLVCKLVEK